MSVIRLENMQSVKDKSFNAAWKEISCNNVLRWVCYNASWSEVSKVRPAGQIQPAKVSNQDRSAIPENSNVEWKISLSTGLTMHLNDFKLRIQSETSVSCRPTSYILSPLFYIRT